MTDRQYSLDEIRLRLNELDDQLLSLLSERRQLSIEVAKSKVETSKPVRDAVREQQLLVKLINSGKDKYGTRKVRRGTTKINNDRERERESKL